MIVTLGLGAAVALKYKSSIAPAGEAAATGEVPAKGEAEHAGKAAPHKGARTPAHAEAKAGPHDPHAAAAVPATEGSDDAEAAPESTGLAERLSWGSGGAEIWRELAAGNERFVSGHPQPRDLVARRGVVAGAQHPPAMVLTCADSRVPPELLLDQGLGDLFVVRTAGNLVDPLVIASFEYAAEHLGSRLLLVLGHERCGAVGAAVKGGKLPTPSLQAMVDPSPAISPMGPSISRDYWYRPSTGPVPTCAQPAGANEACAGFFPARRHTA